MRALKTHTTRRSWFAGLLSTLPTLAQDSASSGCTEANSPNGWCSEAFNGRTVYRRGVGPPIVLLHEINGLSPGCVDLGMELVCKGFTVYMPLLFGHPVQDGAILGFFEACWGSFACSSADKSGAISSWLQSFVKKLSEPVEIHGIGVIGMCLTGALPVYVMQNELKVKAVVMSQPAIPFSKSKQQSIGAKQDILNAAKSSGIPIIGFRFRADTISTAERFRFLQQEFKAQFVGHELDTPPGFHPDLSHRAHAVLTGMFGKEKALARQMVFDFMKGCLQ
jgi:dienelactone hydrolase